MNPYLIGRKVISGVIILAWVAVITFVAFRLMPGNPADIIIYHIHKKLTLADKTAILESFGLQSGKWNLIDFYTYMKDMFTFNFGYDYNSDAPVWTILSQAIPYTLLLLGTAAVIGFAIGIPLGIWVTSRRGTRKEGVSITVSLIVSGIPFFVLGSVFYIYFVAYFRIFPITASFPLYYFSSFRFSYIPSILYHMALPLIILSLLEAAGHMLTMRAAMVDKLGEDYILTARAKGVPERKIMMRHVARNAMIPVSSRMALEFSFLASGALIVAIIFGWPGIGPILYHAALSEDYPLVEGAAFVLSLIVIIIYLAIDYIHAWLDPRLRRTV